MRLILTRRRRRRRGAARRRGASPWTFPPFPDVEEPLSTPVSFFSPVSLWFVAGDLRELRAPASVSLSLSPFEPDRRGPPVSLSFVLNEPFSVGTFGENTFSPSANVLSPNRFLFYWVSPLEIFLFLADGSLDSFL